MSSIVQIEFRVDELIIWTNPDEIDLNSDRIIRLNFLGKVIDVNENEIKEGYKNNQTLLAELNVEPFKAEISVIQKSDYIEKVIGQCHAEFAPGAIDETIEFSEHAILSCKDYLVGCLTFKIILSKYEKYLTKPCNANIDWSKSCMHLNENENYPFERCKQIDPCPTPCEASSIQQFKEYLAEINENSLFVRVSKSSHLVERIYNNTYEGKTACNCCPISYNIKNNDLPLNIQNAKYPKETDCHNLEKRIDCHPKGVEVCQKRSIDPNSDVFILKIGQKLYSNTRNSIELELKTPKLIMQNLPKETKESQVIEKDFETDKDSRIVKNDSKPIEKKVSTKGQKKKSSNKK